MGYGASAVRVIHALTTRTRDLTLQVVTPHADPRTAIDINADYNQQILQQVNQEIDFQRVDFQPSARVVSATDSGHSITLTLDSGHTTSHGVILCTGYQSDFQSIPVLQSLTTDRVDLTLREDYQLYDGQTPLSLFVIGPQARSVNPSEQWLSSTIDTTQKVAATLQRLQKKT